MWMFYVVTRLVCQSSVNHSYNPRIALEEILIFCSRGGGNIVRKLTKSAFEKVLVCTIFESAASGYLDLDIQKTAVLDECENRQLGKC